MMLPMVQPTAADQQAVPNSELDDLLVIAYNEFGGTVG